MPVKDKRIPEEKNTEKSLPEGKELDKAVPEAKELDKPMPPAVKPENVITINGNDYELKPTKLKYQRNRTVAAYHILDAYPLPDILAMDKGVIDPDRDGDEIVYDFLTAVFDSSEIVNRFYDDMDTEIVDRVLKIFKRLNKIDEKEEQAKNREAKATKK